ncbi:3-phosphoshikimate 1-carboxyvinyltransferase [bacterium]|nr:3-phosphoshikimate 1-carboxyvinyltransferase [bacterium]
MTGAGHPPRGATRVPGDKSVSHRALILAALASGTSVIDNLGPGRDVFATRRALESLGVTIDNLAGGAVRVTGRGGALIEPASPIDCLNSGTTMRLLTGLLAGAGVRATLTGDASLSRRPMERVALPLRALGADVRTHDGRPPVEIRSGATRPAPIVLDVASAQVKSAVLLAGLFLTGETSVREPAASRDHTERFFDYTGIPLSRAGGALAVTGPARPRPFTVTVPGDPSSAAFVAAVAALVPGGDVTIRDVLANRSRLGFFDALARMGAIVEIGETRPFGPEDVADIRVRAASLSGIEIAGELALAALDELPLLALVAAFAAGATAIRDAGELRHKESDRVETTAAMIRALGGSVQTRPDGLDIGGGGLAGNGRVRTHGDHRIALCGQVAAACVPGVEIDDPSVAGVSYPDFADAIARLRRNGETDPIGAN